MSITWKRFYRWQIIGLLLSALLLLWGFHRWPIDVWLADCLFDWQTNAFPWRERWFAKTLIHNHLRTVMALLLITLWVTLLRWRRNPARRPVWVQSHWRRLWLLASSGLAVPITIWLLKRFSPMHCAWDVDRYAGDAPYADLLSAFSTPMPYAGHCFPAAFVTSFSWLLALGLLFYPERKLTAWQVGMLALFVSLALGTVQLMRGAHFLSHTLWSLWLAWAIIVGLHALLQVWREPVSTF